MHPANRMEGRDLHRSGVVCGTEAPARIHEDDAGFPRAALTHPGDRLLGDFRRGLAAEVRYRLAAERGLQNRLARAGGRSCAAGVGVEAGAEDGGVADAAREFSGDRGFAEAFMNLGRSVS